MKLSGNYEEEKEKEKAEAQGPAGMRSLKEEEEKFLKGNLRQKGARSRNAFLEEGVPVEPLFPRPKRCGFFLNVIWVGIMRRRKARG